MNNTVRLTDSDQIRQYLTNELADVPLDRQCMHASRLSQAALRRAGVNAVLCMGNVRLTDEWMYDVPIEHFDRVFQCEYPPTKVHIWLEAGGLTIDPTICSTLAAQSTLADWKKADRMIFIDPIGSTTYLEHLVCIRHPTFNHIPLI